MTTILSGWLGDHNQRVGLLGLGLVAALVVATVIPSVSVDASFSATQAASESLQFDVSAGIAPVLSVALLTSDVAVESSFGATMDPAARIELDTTVDAVLFEVIRQPSIYSAWLGDHNQRVGLLALGYIADASSTSENVHSDITAGVSVAADLGALDSFSTGAVIESSFVASMAAESVIDFDVKLDELPVFAIIRKNISSAWLGDNNQRIGVFGLGYLADFTTPDVHDIRGDVTADVSFVPAFNPTVSTQDDITVETTFDVVSSNKVVACEDDVTVGASFYVGVIPTVFTGTIATDGSGNATLTGGSISPSAVGGQVNIGGTIVLVTGVTGGLPPTGFTYTPPTTASGGTTFTTIIGYNPVAIMTWVFDVWWKTERDPVLGWTTPTKIYDSSLNPPGVNANGGICSAGAESLLDTKFGLITSAHTNGTNGFIAFLGDGLPSAPKQISCATSPYIDPTLDSLVTSDYWDMSQGSWYVDGADFVLPEQDTNTNGLRLPMLMSTDGGASWDEMDGANAPGDPTVSNTYVLRRSQVDNHVDTAMFNSSTFDLSLNSFDMTSTARTWTGSYGTVNLGRNVDIIGSGPCGIIRYANSDIGIIYGDYPTSVYYRLYSGGSWGSEITIASGGVYYGNLVIHPSGELLYVFLYAASTIQPACYTVTHSGSVAGPIFTFPYSPGGTDGIGHPIAQDGNLLVPYDMWDDGRNAVWVCPIGTANFVKELLPIPPGERGNPSCSYMLFNKPPVTGSYIRTIYPQGSFQLG